MYSVLMWLFSLKNKWLVMFAVLGLMLWHILYQWDQFTWYHVGSTNLRAGHVNSLYKFLFISFVIIPVVSTSKLNSQILSQMFYWCCLVEALTLKHSVPAPVQLDFFCFSWREKNQVKLIQSLGSMHIGSCPDTVILLCCPVSCASHTGFNFHHLAIGQFIFP